MQFFFTRTVMKKLLAPFIILVFIFTNKAEAQTPSIQASSINFTNITSTSITVNWTNGDGDSRLVMITESSFTEFPIDLNSYVANNAFPFGDPINTAYTVYNGSGSSVTVTGLTPNTSYQFIVYEYNIAGPFYQVNPGSGNPAGTTTCSFIDTGLPVSASQALVCAATGTFIEIGSSQVGVVYQLRNDADDSPIGGSVAGTGGTISLPTGNLSNTTTFNVLATSTCSEEMVQTPTVTVESLPTGGDWFPFVCSGNALNVDLQLNAIAFASSPPSTFVWSATDNPNVSGESLAPQGSPFINDALINNTPNSENVVYTITATSIAGGCVGPSWNITVDVRPKPVLSSALNASLCSGTTTNLILDTNGISVGASSYNVVSRVIDPSLTPIIAEVVPAVGVTSNYLISEIYQNTTNIPLTVVYTIAPFSISGCTGDSQPITITIEPEPVLAATLDAVVCSGSITGITLSTNGVSVVAASYNLNSVNSGGLVPGGGNASVGTGFLANHITGDSYTNSTTSQDIVVYNVSPVSPAGCIGQNQAINLTVNPDPTFTVNNISPVVPSGGITDIQLNSPIGGINYTWTSVVSDPGLTGASTSSGSTIADVLVNSTSIAQTATYDITSQAFGCIGVPQQAIVTVTAPNSCTNPDVAVLGVNNVPAAPYYYTYTSPNNAYLTISSAGSGVDTDLNVYDFCGGTLLAENDDIVYPPGESQLTMQVANGQTILIEWPATYETTGFNFELSETIIDPYEPVSAADSLALVALYNATNGAGWTNRSGWLTTYVNDWYGVAVSGGRVTVLNLAYNNMRGPLPADMGNLTGLTYLNLSRNEFYDFGTGVGYSIPSEIGNLTNLQYLNLDRCGLAGLVPTSIGNLSQLQTLILGFDLSGVATDQVKPNELDPNYPAQIGNLSNLIYLALGGYSTTTVGFPAFIASLTNLEQLYLVGSQFVGAVPNEIGDLSALQVFSINNSAFTSLPAAIQNAPVLNTLYFNDVATLTLPVELASVNTLVNLSIAGNTPLSIDLSTLSTLAYLDISGKGLTSLPSLPTSLITLEAGSNSLTSLEISGLTALTTLHVNQNELTDLPDLTGIPLTTLSIANNRLDFLDLEGGAPPGVTDFFFSPQKPFGNAQSLQLEQGAPLNLNFAVPGTANSYQWKRGTTNVGTNADNFTIGAVTAADEGVYTLAVTNSLVPNLTLTSAPATVGVTPVYPVPGTLFDIVDAGDVSRDGKDVNENDASTIQFYGGSWGDFNNDGFDDLYLGGIANGARNYLYRNNGDGTFTRLPKAAHGFDLNRNGVWGDYNNDGFADYFAPDFGWAFAPDSTDGYAAIYTNNGDETFTSGIIGAQEDISFSGSWFDIDVDGDLDLLAIKSLTLALFRNDGGTFVEVPGLFSTSSNWSVTTVDIDNDGDLDVFMPPRNSGEPKSLYRNNGNGTFTLLNGNLIVTDNTITDPRGGSWADIDNDGDYDFYANNGTGPDGNLFFINDGNGNFTRQTSLAVMGERVTGGRGSVFADFNNDGHVDLFTIQTQTPGGWYLYLNDGDGTFTKETTQSFNNAGGGFVGASVTDFDNDGFQDIFTAYFGADYNALYRNKGNSNNWLQVKLRGTISNRDAIGAKVSVEAGGFWRHHQVITTNGFANQNSLTAHFGLGAATTAESIRIQWPNGFEQVVANVAGNQKILIVEPTQLQQDRAADSLALVALYNATNGPGWTNNTNWLTGTLDTWHGVTVTADRVTGLSLISNQLAGIIPTEIGNLESLTSLALINNSISGSIPTSIGNLSNLTTLDLSLNQLTGSIPPELGNLSGLSNLNLSANQLSGTIPTTFGNLTNLTALYLANNQLGGAVPSGLVNLTSLEELVIFGNLLNSIPNLSSLSSITSFQIQNNRLTFEDIEPNVGISGIVYTPQKPIPSQPDQVLAIGQPLSISYTVDGTANAYQWFKNGTSISGANTATFSKSSVVPADSGRYYLQITNSIAPLLTLRTDSTKISILPGISEADSLVLVAFYNATNGNSWSNNSNWLSNPLTSWFGLTVVNFKITEINLPSNNLVGNIPAELTSLQDLTRLNVAGNLLTGVPNFSSLPSIAQIALENNRLDFGDLEPNVAVPGITYIPQDTVSGYESVLRQVTESQTFTSGVGGTANTYQWKKNGIDIPGATAADLTINNIAFADDAVYTFSAASPLVPGLTLNSAKKILRVSSLQRDSLALAKFYNDTGGPLPAPLGWLRDDNWLLTPLIENNWFGVTVQNNRVVSVVLPDNNIRGALTASIADVQNLEVVDLSGNLIEQLPNLTSLPNIVSLDVSGNKLDFASLIANSAISGIDYQNQAELGFPSSDSVTFGTDFKVKIITKGNGNQFQWLRNGAQVPNATDSTFIIPAINRSNMGDYVVQITNPNVPGLVLRSANKRVLATATLSGRLLETSDTPVADGRVSLFRINPVGGYDTTRIQTVTSAGEFTLANVVLDDYLLLGEADTLTYETTLPTWYKNTLYWEEADTLFVNENLFALDILAQKEPTEAPKGQGRIAGVFEDPSIQEDGRTLRNKRLANAGASVRRRVNVGKPEDEELELVAWIFTNEEGEFEFNNLEQGEYLLNLQYPGVPMDPNSFINISIGTGLARNVQVEAQVIEGKIVVKKLVVTGWDEDETRFKVFPNPANTQLHIQMLQGMDDLSYTVIGTNGSEVLTGELPFKGTAAIHTNSLQPGIYFVQVKQGGQMVSSFRVAVIH